MNPTSDALMKNQYSTDITASPESFHTKQNKKLTSENYSDDRELAGRIGDDVGKVPYRRSIHHLIHFESS
jgi:hypothetical protein